MPLLMTPAGELLLPALADDATYSISADADTIVIETVHAQVLTFNLSENAPNADAGDASRFIVNGQNGYLDGAIHSSGAAQCAAEQRFERPPRRKRRTLRDADGQLRTAQRRRADCT